MDVTKGYKAFRKGLICESDKEHRKQYQENTDYEEEGGRICNPGMMHYCLTPLDCLQHYNLIDENGDLVEICEVQALATPVTDDSREYATQKLHIGAKLQMKDWIKASVSIMRESIKENGRSGGNWSKLAGGDRSKLAGGDESQLAGGNWSQLAGGNWSQLAGGNWSKLAGGDESKLAGGNGSQLAGGNWSQLAGGNGSQLAGGNWSKLAGGDESQLAGGNGSQLAGGNWSQLAGGNGSQLAGGDGSILVGDSRSILKGGLGSLLVIAERDTEGNITGHAAGIVDGESIRPDTWYCLKDGKLTEAER